tara:strand:- start:896 stop:1714 length:819 start_codon:yes stop_codon:yes gene_type:complete
MPYVGNMNTTFTTLTSSDANITDDLTVTDDASVGGDLTLTGSLKNSSGDLTVDIAGDIVLDSDGGALRFKDAGTAIGVFRNSSTHFQIECATSNSDMRFNGSDGGSGITALTLDMSEAGTASFNNMVLAPNQPAFSAKLSSSVDNLSIGGASNTHIVFGSERFDQNADYNVSDGLFTAPVTGKYLLSFHLRLQNIDTATNTYDFLISTSNVNYQHRFDPDFGDSDTAYYHANLTVVADMDANDTANIEYYVDAGTAQTDIDTNSYFMGYLLG